MEQEHNPVAKVNEIDLVNDPSTSFWLPNIAVKPLNLFMGI
jgi:hypothetical protein